MTKKIVGLIQARMGSKRLPDKVMLPLAGKPLFWHVVDRLKRVPDISDIVLATTQAPENDVLVAHAEELNLIVYREKEENDIAARLSGAMQLSQADSILKVNADCPLIDPKIMMLAIAAYKADEKTDYVSNKINWTYPKGMSLEIISRHAVDWCHKNLNEKTDREYVADWIKNHPEIFKVDAIEYHKNLSHLDLMVDTHEEYKDMKKIFAELYCQDEVFGLDEILDYLAHSTIRAKL